MEWQIEKNVVEKASCAINGKVDRIMKNIWKRQIAVDDGEGNGERGGIFQCSSHIQLHHPKKMKRVRESSRRGKEWCCNNKNNQNNHNIKNETQRETERNIWACGGKKMRMGCWCFPAVAAACLQHRGACLLLSRKNPIHKQDLKTGDSDWFPECCVCVLYFVYVCEHRIEGKEDMEQEWVWAVEKTQCIPVRVMIWSEWMCRACVCVCSCTLTALP